MRIHLPMQGSQVRSLLREDPTCLRATKSVHHSTQPVHPQACSPQQEEPCSEKAPLLQPERACAAADTARPQVSLSNNITHLGLLHGASGKEPAYQCVRRKRRGFDVWVGKIPWRRACNPLQYSYLEDPTDRGAWRAAVHGATNSGTWLK